GYLAQASYIFDCDFEIIGRYSSTTADEEISDYLTVESSDFYTLGVSQYLKGHTIKIQLDGTYISNSIFNENEADDSWNFRLQLTLGI
ncbi:MAG TPA: hypothetical protein VH917_07195, partial [Ignavibacteriaceae bacterium]